MTTPLLPHTPPHHTSPITLSHLLLPPPPPPLPPHALAPCPRRTTFQLSSLASVRAFASSFLDGDEGDSTVVVGGAAVPVHLLVLNAGAMFREVRVRLSVSICIS